MDTSDSEAFESADENFEEPNVASNDDEDHTIAPLSVIDPKSVSSDDEDVQTVTQNPELVLSDILQNITELHSDKHDDVKDVTSGIQNLKVDSDVNPEELQASDDEEVTLPTKSIELSKLDSSKRSSEPEVDNENHFAEKDLEPSFSEESKISIKTEIKNVIPETKIKEKLKEEILEKIKEPLSVEIIDTPDEVGSGWDDDVDWIAIDDQSNPKPQSSESDLNPTDSGSGWDEFNDWEEKPKPEVTESGWDDFDNWDTIEETPPLQVQPVLDKLNQAKSSWGSWGAWDVTSVLSAATESVSKLTSVIESGIGAPSPEEMAQIQKTVEPPAHELQTPLFGFGNILSGVNQVVNTGLDTLEVIGKKTMEVLQEGDPRLEKKRNLLGLTTDKPCLSQVLREAKEKAATNQDIPIEQKMQVRKVHFESLFDDYQGLVHLEALEMLSKQCDIKLSTTVESLEGSNLEEFNETMLQVKELCELPDEEEEEQLIWEEIQAKLQTVVDELNIQISFEKLLGIWVQVEGQIKGIENEVEVHQKAIDTLAMITAAGVEQFHKCAELLLVKERRSTADEADSLVQLTTTLIALIGLVAAKFSEKLDSLGSGNDNPDLNDLITNVFFEATQSSSYIQDAFQLFVPILQIGAV